MTETNHLALPYIDAAQAQKHVTHNEALQILDALIQLSVLARDQLAPPPAPLEGDRYIVGAGATGAFAGKEGKIAAWLSGGWMFLSPRAGWIAHVVSEASTLIYDGTAWGALGAALGSVQDLALLGVGTTADPATPFTAKLGAAAFAALTVAEGGAGDLRVKLVKEAAVKTASHLYQTNWSGRAEIGLIGDDDLRVKVSADGAAWRDAMLVDRATGRVAFPSGAGDGSLAGFRNRLRNASVMLDAPGLSGAVTLAAGAFGPDGLRAGDGGATYSLSGSGADRTITISAGSIVFPIDASAMEGGAFVLSHAGTAQARIWQTSPSGAFASVPSSGLVAAGLGARLRTAVEFSTGTVLRPQLEPGLYPSQFERRPRAVELLLCERRNDAAFVTPNIPQRNWVTSQAWIGSTSAADNDWQSVCWAPEPGLFAAIASTGAGNRVMTSPDGVNWTARASAADNSWRSICWSRELGLFVAVSLSGAGNRVMTSPDGVNWTLRSSAADNNWRSVCWSREVGLLVAVASSGTGDRVMTSPDGVTWTARASAADNNWQSVCWAREIGLFAAVANTGVGNRVMTSPDGVNWTLRTSAADNQWASLCWSREIGLFAAVATSGAGNRVMTSPDGVNWSARVSAADNQWASLCWAREIGLFAAVASSGTGNRVMTSPDGVNWTLRTSAADNNWTGVCWARELGLFAAVAWSGAGSRAMTSKSAFSIAYR
jgi:hypothetical protein